MNINPPTVRQLALLILGFTEEATPTEEDITKAYQRTSKLCHPDVGGSAEMFRALSLSKEFLMNNFVGPSRNIFVTPQPQKPAWRPPTPPPPPPPDPHYSYENFRKKNDKSDDIPW
jgi:hypothetical protein